ncbi:MAG: hypothetical protein U5O39_14035 [Gammaproteobacteria bacterium]|nr:hypothetical protein [Gammaproteobacteria bacterium]
MRYVALAITCAFIGFVGAWLLFRQATPKLMPTPTAGGQTVTTHTVSSETERAQASRQQPIDFEMIAESQSIFDQLYMAWQLAAQSDVGELEALLDRTLTGNDPVYRHNIASIFLERYVELDPEGAMAFVDSDHRFNQLAMKSHVLTSWVRYDPETALDWFRSVNDRRLVITAGARLLEDPTLAATGLRRQIIDIIGDEQAARILQRVEMKRSDPAELFETARLMSGQDRQTRMQFAVTRWAEQDPEVAIARIRSLPDDAERERLLQIAVSTYARQDAEAALGYVQTHFPDNQNLMVQAINMLAARDVQRALPHAEDLQRRFGDMKALTYVLRAWANKSPRDAIGYASSLTAEQQRSVYPALAHSWMRRDPAATIRWLASLGDEFSDVKRSALQIRSSGAMTAGERLLPTVTDPMVREQLITSIAHFKSNRNAQEALAWIEEYADEPAYNRSLPTIMANLARSDPERAARFIESNPGNKQLARSASTLAQVWYRTSPTQASEWLTSLPASDMRDKVISQVSMIAAIQDGLDPAIELLDLLPPGATRDNAVRQVAFNWVRRSPGRTEEAISRLDLTPELAEQLRAQGDN